MQINEPSGAKESAPLWRLAFRAGFLLAAAFAVTGMLRWLWWMWVPGHWPEGLPPQWWHGHEMVYGFAMPVVAGFLLTAVATWTGIPGTRGRRLQALFGLWLLARLILWLIPAAQWLAWSTEMGFMLILMWELTGRVWARRQWRNLPFTPVLLALALLDTASHASMDNPLKSSHLHYGAIWLVAVFVLIVGGRIIPLFTGNRMGFKITPSPVWLEWLAIVSVAFIALAVALFPAYQSQPWWGWLCMASALIHCYRLGRWRGWKTVRVPLLWSMHLSYLCIPLALAGLGLVAGDPVAVKHLIHLLAIGTIGGMIISMMSRVSLGHTGRPLEVPGYVSAAFALILLAAVIRAFVPLLWVDQTLPAWRLSAVLWIVAFSCFLTRYIPVLTRPRADGQPG